MISSVELTERHLVGELDAPADRLDGLALHADLAGDVAFGVLIVLALDIDVRAQAVDGADGVRRIVDRHPADVLEGGEHLRSQRLGEHRPSRPLVHEAIGGQRDDEHVAETPRRLEMAHMAQVKQVECAVGLRDDFARALQARNDVCELVDRADLVCGTFRDRQHRRRGPQELQCPRFHAPPPLAALLGPR